jgi:drug/metabolite transporter (DMT)-like permease
MTGAGIRAATPPPRGDIIGALGWMLLALLAFSTFAIGGREAGREIDAMQIMLWRGPISLVILLAIAALTGARPRTERLPLHIARSVFHFGAQYSWLTALGLIPLAELFALEFTAPLWVALIAPIVLKERLTPSRIAAAGLGFAGVMIVVQPGSTTLSAGTLFALASALGFAGSMIATKMLTRTDAPFTILVYMMGIQTVFALVGGLPSFVMPTAATLGWIVLISIAGLVAHFSLARAFSKADAVLVAPMDFLRLPLIAAVGAFLYGETVELSLIVGGVVVVAGNLLNIRGERRKT